MSHDTVRHHCARCGDRIGVYEPLLCRRADGTVLSGSLLTLRAELAQPTVKSSRLFHAGCFAVTELEASEAGSAATDR